MSDIPTNREIGHAWTAHILGELFDEWPRRVDFNAMDIETSTEVGPRKDGEDFFDHLFEWLKDEGFVRFTQATEGNVYDVSLTEKGVNILGQKLGIEAKEPIGTQLKGIAKSAGSEAGRAAISEAVGYVIGGAIKAMSS